MIPFTVTFYSYKGGVGRSLLAANIGVLRARRGKTLLWDLDIEAPGLHHIPRLKPTKPIKRGFFEWLTDWQSSGRRAEEADFAGLVKLVRPTPVADGLSILPAFADGADFAALYQGIRWDEFLVRDLDNGLALFRGALEALGAAGFETILLDARTGITDIGGLLAALLPHATVLVGNYGSQNTKGLAHVWQALQAAADGKVARRGTLPPLTRLLVASPIADDVAHRSSGEAIWTAAFGLAPSERVTIPYDAELLFSEALYAAERPDSPVAKAYGALDARIEAVHAQALAERAAAQRSADARPDLLPRRSDDRSRQGKTFEERVAHLLRLLGYTVEREQLIDANRVDLVARKRVDFGREDVFLVECKDHQAVIPKETVQIFKTWLEGPSARQMQARGMVVAAKDFSPAARTYAREQGLQALTYDELERSLFDFAPYLARIRQRYEASPLAHSYVDQFLKLEKAPDAEPAPMLQQALAWAGGSGSGSRLWLILGDYGTGKSTLVERLAYELARRCESDPASTIPIAINLRQFPNAISLESLIREHLEGELRAVFNPEIILHLLEAGRVVLLLDSFDEMGVAQAGRSVEEQFRQLVRPTANPGRDARGNRILITSRSHFFRDSGSARRAVEGGDPLFEADSALGQAARAFDATLDTLPVFTSAQIGEYLHKRLGQVEGDRAERRIKETYGLREIASTPQLLDMIVASLPDLLTMGEQVTTAGLYLTYTNRWLDTFRLSRAEVGVDHLRELLERMACELWRRPRNQIHYADLATLLREERGLSRGIDSERVDLELRTAAFLVRSADGYYRFSHRSFLEFFFARALFRGVKEGRLGEMLAGGRVNREAGDFLLQLVDAEPATAEQFNAALRGILAATYVAGVSENALFLAQQAVTQRLPMVKRRAPVGLLELAAAGEGPLPASREDIDAQYRLVIPPAAQLVGARLAGIDLPGLCAEAIDLRGADLRRAVLIGARLPQARLDHTVLDDARLDFADLSQARLDAASALRICGQGLRLTGTDCTRALFDGADLRESDARGAVFNAASLRLCRLAGADFTDARLDTADLAGGTWPQATGYDATAGLAPHQPQLAGLIGHGGAVRACAFSPDYSADRGRILTAGDDGARLWDAASGKELRRFAAGAIFTFAFAPDGRHVLTAGNDAARLWDATSGQELRRFLHDGTVRACTFSPDGHRVLTAGSDGYARLWDTASGAELRRFRHGGTVHACAISPDSDRIITAGGDGKHSNARVWDAESGAELRRFAEHAGAISSCVFSADGGQLLTIGEEGMRLWDSASGSELRRFSEHSNLTTTSVFSPDGGQILTVGLSYVLWDAVSGAQLHHFTRYSFGWTFACAFSPDGSRVLAGGGDGARLLDASSGAELRSFARHTSPMFACAFSPDGGQIATAGDGARLWDAAGGTELHRFAAHSGTVLACAFSPSGALLTASSDGACLWDAASRTLLRRFVGHEDWVRACAFSPDGRQVLTAGDDGSARLWDVASSTELCRFDGHGDRMLACAFALDGRQVLTAGDDGSACLWDVSSGVDLCRFTGHGGAVYACAFAPDGRTIVTAGADGYARLWDAAAGTELHLFEGHGGTVQACAFSPDGGYVLTAGNDGTARLWYTSSGAELRRFGGNGGALRACAFSPDGHRIVTAGADGTARLWDVASGQELLAMAADGNAWLAWRADENRWDGEGDLADWLRYRDAAETDTGEPGWVPRHWLAADLPELRGFTPLPPDHGAITGKKRRVRRKPDTR